MDESKIKKPILISNKSPAHPENQKEAAQLESLKAQIMARSNSKLLTEDAFLLKYLRYSKNNVDATFDMVIAPNAITRQVKPPSYFKDSLIKSKILVPLEYSDEFGRQVFLFRIGEWNPSKLSMLDMMTQCYYVEEVTASRQLTQLNGIVMIFDMKGFRFEHFTTFTKSSAQLFVGNTECMPLKVKGVHVINNGPFFSFVYKLIRPLLKVKLRNRIFVHDEDLSSLHKEISQSILPLEFGGKLCNDEWEEKGYIEDILERDDYYKNLLKATVLIKNK